jgi:DNA polymerase III subunit gamma/tau
LPPRYPLKSKGYKIILSNIGVQLEYLVLARKFRPQTFADVAGQEHVVKTLRNAIGQGRVAHAFLFAGPRGVGKTSVARILAKSLNCEKGPTATPCNVCSSCLEITNGSSMDVREIDGASNRGIDEIRELRENVKFAPAASRYKIYIIDEVHMLTREAFNALLKTLEEPPAHVIFIFATTENHKVPATILSRCQCYDFRRISLAEIAENLGKVAGAEKIKISPTALSWVAEAGDGSMRDAQSIFDQVISYAGMNINDTDVEEILGLVDRKYLFRISEAILQRDAGTCLIILEEAYLAGLDMKHFYQMMLKHFRNMLLVKIVADGGSAFDITPEQIEQLKIQVQNVTRETIQRYVEILIAEEESFRRSQEARLKLETIIVKMAYLEPIIPLGEIISTIETIEQKLNSGYKVSKEITPPPISAPSAVSKAEVKSKVENIPPAADIKLKDHAVEYRSTADLAELCSNFKKFVKKENPPLAAKIESAEFLSYSGGALAIGFPKGYIFLDDISEKTQKARLEQVAGNFFQEAVTIKITETAAKVNANGSNGRGKSNGHSEIRREAMNNPLLQKVLDEVDGAEIVEIKTRVDKSS